MMTKKVLIVIGSLSLTHKKHLPGSKVDGINWQNYFLSATGGGFYKYEIKILENPSFIELFSEINSNVAEYSIVIFSGHGFFSVQLRQTVLQINDQETFPSSYLLNGSSRQLIVIDSCQNLDRKQSSNFIGDAAPYLDFPNDLMPYQARTLLDENLRQGPPGTAMIFSSSVGHSSWSTPNGSNFSNAILTSARNWASHFEPNCILTISGAHDFSIKHLKKNAKQIQRPEILRSNNRVNFPFAVRYSIEIAQFLFANDYYTPGSCFIDPSNISDFL